MSEKKPIPNTVQRTTKNCPVCGAKAYSLEGIHPQCAVLQADAPRKERLVAEKKAEANRRRIANEEIQPEI